MSFLFVVLLYVSSTASQTHGPAIQRTARTSGGVVRGSLTTASLGTWTGRAVVYRGLQYASLQGGSLRFMPPTGVSDRWTGVRAATRFGPVCPQRVQGCLKAYLTEQSEECLYLNVYVPASENNTRLLPVIVLINGDSYESGTGNAYDGSVLAMFGKVIVITINYRLGALGFLSSGDSNAPGNYALLDIIAALQWVQMEIAGFGGDRSAVTLLGNGHGAALVSLLLLSPITRGTLFCKRAILLGGTALSTWAVASHPLRYTTQLAKTLNCSSSLHNSAALTRCLKNAPVEKVLRANVTAPKYQSAFAPVVNKQSVLPAQIRTLLDEPHSAFRSVDLLVGVKKGDGVFYLPPKEPTDDADAESVVRVIRTYIRNNYPFHRQKVYEVIVHAYTEWERTSRVGVSHESLAAMLRDAQFVAPAVHLLRHHVKMADDNSRAYFLNFYWSHRSSGDRSPFGDWNSDLEFLLGVPVVTPDVTSPITFTMSDRMLSEALMTYVANFVYSGDPVRPRLQNTILSASVTNRFVGVDWPPYDSKQQYLHMSMRPGARSHYRGAKVALWLDLISSLQRPDGLEWRYHLLQDAHIASSFEPNGTKHLEEGFEMTTTVTPVNCVSITVKPPSRHRFRPSCPTERSPSRHPKLRDRQLNKARPSDKTCRNASIATGGDVTMSVTIAVGCALLFLNVIIFFGTYHRRKEPPEKNRDEQQHIGADLDSSLTPTSSDCSQLSPFVPQPSQIVHSTSRSLGDPAELGHVPDYYQCKRSSSMQFQPMLNGGRKAASTLV